MCAEALRRLYESVWPAIAALPTDQGLSHPLFISLPDDYETATFRVMVVGKETYSWYGLLGSDLGDDPVGTIQGKYKKFAFGPGHRSHFCRAFRRIRESLAAHGPGVGFAWSNVFPCDQWKHGPEPGLREPLLGLRLLPREVEILRPHAVVLFTGPRYDKHLKRLFPGATPGPCQAPDGLWIPQITAPGVSAKMLRTYHPAYRKWKKRKETISAIISILQQIRQEADGSLPMLDEVVGVHGANGLG